MNRKHHYRLTVKWTGNKGEGTSHYRSYDREHTVNAAGKPEILCSSDPAFRGDKSKYNPEELFLASVSSCHMLWYLHLCAEAGIIVVEYSDDPTATMEESEDGNGRFSEVILHPKVSVRQSSMVEKANNLHHEANKYCFIANSLNFKVQHRPECSFLEDSSH